MEPSRRASCVLLVNQETDEFLAVSLKRDFTDFNLPGGKVEDEEDYAEAAIRELLEETGLVVEIDNLYYLHTGTDLTEDGRGGDFRVITFYCHQWKGELKAEDGGGLVKWAALDDLPKITKTWPVYNAKVLEKYRLATDDEELFDKYLQDEEDYYQARKQKNRRKGNSGGKYNKKHIRISEAITGKKF